jgi:hypothetical protein
MTEAQSRYAAELWCLLNGGIWPQDVRRPVSMNAANEDACVSAAYAVLNEVAGQDGLRLWAERFDHGRSPTTGQKMKRTASAS